MLRRLFGRKKKEPEVPQVSLDETSERLGNRTSQMDQRIEGLETELRKVRVQLKTAKGPAAQRIKSRALQLLKQKRMYEQQRGRVQQQQFNLDQVSFAKEMIQTNVDMVACMKSSTQELKSQMQSMKISDIESIHDEMSDLLEDTNEISDLLGEGFGMEEYVDEDELLSELDALGEEGDASLLGELDALGEEPESSQQGAGVLPQQQQQQQQNQHASPPPPALSGGQSVPSGDLPAYPRLPAAPGTT